MDWEIIIETLNATVRDDEAKAEFYRYLMLNGFHDDAENFLGEDELFDDVWNDIAEESSDDDKFVESINEFYDDQE